jgi:DNA-directed RNA polymerase subunit alpha
VICTVGAGGKFSAELHIRAGKGYVTSESIKEAGLPVGVIPLDAVFSPVRRVSFSVAETRVGQRSDFNKLVLEVSTNGAVSPEDALAYSAKILKDQVSVFINFQEADEEAPVAETVTVDARVNESLYKSVMSWNFQSALQIVLKMREFGILVSWWFAASLKCSRRRISDVRL